MSGFSKYNLKIGNVTLYLGALPAGRELDALIAERILGWARHGPCGKCSISPKHECLTTGNAELVYLGDNWDGAQCHPLLVSPGGKQFYLCPCQETKGEIDLPAWSTDVALAWEMVESLGQQITLFRNLWANGIWHWHCHIGGGINDTNETSIETEKVAHAICLAALLYQAGRQTG